MNNQAIVRELVKLAKSIEGGFDSVSNNSSKTVRASLSSGDVIRSSFFPDDILNGTRLFVIELENSGVTQFAIETRFEIFGYTTDIKKALGAFEDMLMVDNASQIPYILKKNGIKRRKLAKSLNARSGKPVDQALSNWNDIHDMITSLEYARGEYDTASSYRGQKGSGEAQDIVDAIDRVLQKLDAIAFRDLKNLVNLENRFVKNHGTPEDFAENARREIYPS